METEWRYAGTRHLTREAMSDVGMTVYAVEVPHKNGSWDAIYAKTEEQARRIVAAVNHADALAAALRGLVPPDEDCVRSSRGEEYSHDPPRPEDCEVCAGREALRAYDAAKAAPDAGSSEGGT